MRVEARGLPPIEIDSDGVTDPQVLIDRLIGSEAGKAAIAEIARLTFYTRYETWQDMDARVAAEFADVLFERGREGVEDHITNLVDENDAGADGEEALRDGLGETLVDALAEAVAEATGEDEDDVKDMVRASLEEPVRHSMEEQDRSVPLDVIPAHVRAEVFYVFGLDGNAVDDFYLRHESNVCNLGTVEPNETLKALFEGANLSFESFRQEFLAKRGIDLRGGPGHEPLVAWLAQEDYITSRDNARERALERAEQWAEFAPRHDPSRPAVMDFEGMFEVLDNATGGGVPAYVGHLRLRDLVEHDWTQGMLVERPANHRNGNGGFIGILEPKNGSGHPKTLLAPLTLPPGLGNWRASGHCGYRINSIFDIVESYYHAKIQAVPAPALEPEEPEAAPAPGM